MIRPFYILPLLFLTFLSGAVGYVKAHRAAPVTAQDGRSAAIAPVGDVEAIIFAAADQYGVPRNLARAVLTQESGGDPSSTSSAGAAGLMQVMPATAVGIAADLGVASYDIYDPQTNATFGMYYLRQKIARYGVVWGLAAYNWGPGAVDAFLSRHPDAQGMDWGAVVASYGGEIPGETQHYVANILAMAAREEAPALQAGRKCPVTETMAVSAHFSSTGSQFWAGQAGGMHNGTDFSGQPGDPVYAPFDLVVEDIQYYGDSGRIGWYVQGRFADGYLFYAGHLGTVAVQVGQSVAACTPIGTIGEVFHTHVKINRPGSPEPCEATGCDDFEEYYATH